MESHFTIPTDPLLQNFIVLIWQTNGYPGYSKETIIPKGAIEIIFNFTEREVFIEIGNQKLQLPRCFIYGFNSDPILLAIPRRQVFFGIQLQPHAVGPVFKVPAGEFADKCIDLSLIDASIERLWHQLGEASYFSERCSIFTKWLLDKARRVVLDERQQEISDFLYKDQQQDHSVQSLTRKMFYSPRHLSRKFREMVAMNTEEVLLYKKYLHSLKLIHESKFSLTGIAYACNFADQSHFIRTFRSFTHLSPGEYKKLKSSLPGHIYQ